MTIVLTPYFDDGVFPLSELLPVMQIAGMGEQHRADDLRRQGAFGVHIGTDPRRGTLLPPEEGHTSRRAELLQYLGITGTQQRRRVFEEQLQHGDVRAPRCWSLSVYLQRR